MIQAARVDKVAKLMGRIANATLAIHFSSGERWPLKPSLRNRCQLILLVYMLITAKEIRTENSCFGGCAKLHCGSWLGRAPDVSIHNCGPLAEIVHAHLILLQELSPTRRGGAADYRQWWRHTHQARLKACNMAFPSSLPRACRNERFT